MTASVTVSYENSMNSTVPLLVSRAVYIRKCCSCSPSCLHPNLYTELCYVRKCLVRTVGISASVSGLSNCQKCVYTPLAAQMCVSGAPGGWQHNCACTSQHSHLCLSVVCLVGVLLAWYYSHKQTFLLSLSFIHHMTCSPSQFCYRTSRCVCDRRSRSHGARLLPGILTSSGPRHMLAGQSVIESRLRVHIIHCSCEHSVLFSVLLIP